MNRNNRAALSCVAVFCIATLSLAAAERPAGDASESASSGGAARSAPSAAIAPAEAYSADAWKGAIDAGHREYLALESEEIPASELGDWADAIDATAFSLFRATELYRGEMRIMVIDRKGIDVRAYPDGTIVLSSGLLDYVDSALFDAASVSSRRVRQFDRERERSLAPFLATEAAHFALDHGVAAYAKRGAVSRYDAEQVFEADGLAIALLDLADYDSSAYDTYLSTLDRAYREGAKGTLAPYFASWLATLPSPGTRIASLDAAREVSTTTTAYLSDAVSALAAGNGFAEAAENVDELRARYPRASWLDRLEARLRFLEWESTIEGDKRGLLFCLDSGTRQAQSRREFKIDVAERTAGTRAGFLSNSTAVPGNADLRAKASAALERVPSVATDGLSPLRATLLAYSGVAANRDEALRRFEALSLAETGSPVGARANYAAALWLMGTDRARALYLMGSLVTASFPDLTDPKAPVTTKRSVPNRASAGFGGDATDLLVNYALMLEAAGDAAAAQDMRARATGLLVPPPKASPLTIRKIRTGMGSDDLIALWGTPGEIRYAIQREEWRYPSQNVTVVLVNNVASEIRIGEPSPVSPGGDVRTGDKRANFEGVFGKAAYWSHDRDVYLLGGSRVSVLYLAGTIREIAIGQ